MSWASNSQAAGIALPVEDPRRATSDKGDAPSAPWGRVFTTPPIRLAFDAANSCATLESTVRQSLQSPPVSARLITTTQPASRNSMLATDDASFDTATTPPGVTGSAIHRGETQPALPVFTFASIVRQSHLSAYEPSRRHRPLAGAPSQGTSGAALGGDSATGRGKHGIRRRAG